LATKTLLDLRIEDRASQRLPSHYQRLQELAKDYSIQFSPITLANVTHGAPIPDDYWQALNGASAFWIGDAGLLADPRTRQIVEAKLEAGAIAICDVRSGSITQAPGVDFFMTWE
jgi:hypothetical protein